MRGRVRSPGLNRYGLKRFAMGWRGKCLCEVKGLRCSPILLDQGQSPSPLLHARKVSDRYPPHCQVRPLRLQKPLAPVLPEFQMRGFENISLQIVDAFPDGHVEENLRRITGGEVIRKRSKIIEIADFRFETPDKAPTLLRQSVDFVQSLDQARQARVIEPGDHLRNIYLREVMNHGSEA